MTIVLHRGNQCQECGASLVESPVMEWDLRQVQDLPPIGLQVIEHQAEVKVYPVCSKLNRGEFLVEVNSVVQYGATLKGRQYCGGIIPPQFAALMVYLLGAQLLPSERVCDLLRAVVGCEVSEGTLYNARERCYEQLASVESQTIEAIQGVEVGHFDERLPEELFPRQLSHETGMRVNGKLWWLHVACTDALTYYFVHAKWGKLAMDSDEYFARISGHQRA